MSHNYRSKRRIDQVRFTADPKIQNLGEVVETGICSAIESRITEKVIPMNTDPVNLQPPNPIRLMIVMGVSGSGKTIVGNHLANHLKVEFIDGDDLHPPENVERMRAGVKLDDETRKPWLEAICQRAESHFENGQSVVIACSALKLKYRTQLRSVSRPVVFVFLHGAQALIQARMDQRTGHYMPTSLLDSQFDELEDPRGEAGVVAINVDQPLDGVLKLAVGSFQ